MCRHCGVKKPVWSLILAKNIKSTIININIDCGNLKHKINIWEEPTKMFSTKCDKRYTFLYLNVKKVKNVFFLGRYKRYLDL